MISKDKYIVRMDNFQMFMDNYSVMSDFFVVQFENSAEMSAYADKRFKRRHIKHLRRLFFQKYKEIFGDNIKQAKQALKDIENQAQEPLKQEDEQIADNDIKEPAAAGNDGTTDTATTE